VGNGQSDYQADCTAKYLMSSPDHLQLDQELLFMVKIIMMYISSQDVVVDWW